LVAPFSKEQTEDIISRNMPYVLSFKHYNSNFNNFWKSGTDDFLMLIRYGKIQNGTWHICLIRLFSSLQFLFWSFQFLLSQDGYQGTGFMECGPGKHFRMSECGIPPISSEVGCSLYPAWFIY